MVDLLPNLQAGRSAGSAATRGIEAVLSAALTAHKAGTLLELFRRHPRIAARCRQRYYAVVAGTAGDALADERRDAQAATLLMRWALSQVRPDKAPVSSEIARSAWLDRTSWRPVLSVLCHYGFEPVPPFPERYHRRPDEAAADSLCGLWGVGPSTFYRYLDKGRRWMAAALATLPDDAAQRVAMRQTVAHEVYRLLSMDDREQRRAWHRRQATRAVEARDATAALWHLCAADDVNAALEVLGRFRTELAGTRETDVLLDGLAADMRAAPMRVAVLLGRASLAQVRNDEERERLHYEDALRIAFLAQDDLLLGRVYGALGKFYEPRDTDRAMSCLEDCAQFMRRAGQVDERFRDTAWRNEYVLALQKLAWLYVQRSDPRARAVLEQADTFRAEGLDDETSALLEQAWGEYWRRSGELRRAVECQHRVLNIFERLGHVRQILSTYNNLGIVYGEAKQYALAVEYGRKVVDMARHVAVDPYVLAGAHINLGVAHFWQEQYDDAIGQYQAGLAESLKANLPVYVNRAHYNLAEAYYKRFQLRGNLEDERLGDQHAAAAIRAGRAQSDLRFQEAARNLKAEVLGAHEGLAYWRLLPEEFAAHFDEMAEVQRHRAALALPAQPEERVRAHLAIANAYLGIAAKERNAAKALIERFGLEDGFGEEFERLRASFSAEVLSQEQRLGDRWRRTASDMLNDERRRAVLTTLLRGEPLSKSSYAQLCGVGPATASKHLALLSQRGLLVQVGRGPATRYELVQRPNADARAGEGREPA